MKKLLVVMTLIFAATLIMGCPTQACHEGHCKQEFSPQPPAKE